MDVSLFLAKVMGFYLLIIALAMFINGHKIKPIVLDMIRTPALMFLIGIICVILGLLVVVAHNLWLPDWRVLITILGWLTLIKGIFRIVFPQKDVKAIAMFVENNAGVYIAAFINLILGIVLIYFAYME